MTDLVTRLRDCAHHARRLIPPRADTIDEAAAEIERLREIIRAADALRGWKALHELPELMAAYDAARGER